MKKASILVMILMACGFLASGPAHGDMNFDIPGEYRFRVNWLSDFPVNDEGRELGRNYWHESRLRVSPELLIGDNLGFYSQADLFSGLVSGDKADLGTDFANLPWDGEDDYDDFYLRQLWFEWQSPVGVLRLGQMASHWGLGLVSNDGEDRFNEFGESYFGDLYWRALFATKPFSLFSKSAFADRLVMGVGYDIVWWDDNASYEDGDRGAQWIFSCFYDDPDHVFLGVYVAMRDQEDDDEDDVEANAYDIYFNWKSRPKGSRPIVSVAFEGAMVEGWTDRVIHENAPEELDLEGIGAVFRAGLFYPDHGVRLGLEGGYASGDANSYDDTNYAFSFDPNYHVGIVLFNEVIASLSAVQPEPLGDPDRVKVPQKGIDQLPTDGSVTNALYQSVFASYIPTDGKGLTLKGGVLHAEAAEDFMDPYLTFREGGVPTNFQGRECKSRELGWEIDTEVGYQYVVGSRLKLSAGVQYGYFLPGEAFEDEQGDRGDPIDKIQARVTIGW
jgi:hypothetical protein